MEKRVFNPNHYIGLKGLEAEEVLRNFIPYYTDGYVAHRIASSVEYLLRAPRKNGLEDLKKSRYNIDQAIEHIEKEGIEINESI